MHKWILFLLFNCFEAVLKAADLNMDVLRRAEECFYATLYDEAEKIYQEVAASTVHDPENKEAYILSHLRQGQIFLTKGNPQLAIEILSDVAFDSTYPHLQMEAVYSLAYAYVKAQETGKAISAFEQCFKLNSFKTSSFYPHALLELAMLYFENGDLDEALAKITELKEQVPIADLQEKGELILVKILRSKGNLNESCSHLHALMDKLPPHSKLHEQCAYEFAEDEISI
ncbi:MAG TPA: tetratricopeptide repeat protein, partial [Waddliaceae bacterium]